MKPTQNYRDLYVTDISFEATEQELRQLFSLCGSVKSLQLVKDAHDNFKGMAYVRMGSEKETREALNMLDGTLIQNRCIKVELSRSKEERAAAAVEEVQEQKTRRRRTPKGRKKTG
ncbi:MAG: RNA-binding protein [Desulfuromonadales bacterium]|nr:RNA-binding protein [Desulfuromonadales bacterium]MBN2793281.1 RNA-binding protein [Desulfuromonadales bacterium]